MLRPQYETQADLSAEKLVAEYIESISQKPTRLYKLPKSYHLDWCITEQVGSAWLVTGWGELKIRKMTKGQYPDVMLSVIKMVFGINLSLITGLPFIFYVKRLDGLMFHTVITKPNWYQIDYGGRTLQTRDSADIEPVYRIPMESFIELENH